MLLLRCSSNRPAPAILPPTSILHQSVRSPWATAPNCPHLGAHVPSQPLVQLREAQVVAHRDPQPPGRAVAGCKPVASCGKPAGHAGQGRLCKLAGMRAGLHHPLPAAASLEANGKKLSEPQSMRMSSSGTSSSIQAWQQSVQMQSHAWGTCSPSARARPAHPH